MLHIAPQDKVLEVGSGNRPRRRSNVLCDRYVADNTQRSGGDRLIIDTRPFVVADVASLPFKDKSFDYVIASHILEHVDDPIAVAAELMRVGHAGYIETPSELCESLLGWSFHKWIVHREDDALVMRPRTRDSAFGEYFHRAYASNQLFAEFVDTHYDDFYVRYEWKDVIRIRIDRSEDDRVRFNRTSAAVETLPPVKVALLRTLESALGLPMFIARHLRKFER